MVSDAVSPEALSALAGLRVIDLSRVLGGPYCTQILGDHGADVIKVEPPQGDETRAWGPPFVGDGSAYYAGVNRNKRGMVLDLTQPEARAVLLRLLETADVLVENFKTGTLERWGIGYQDVLRHRFPRLIHCRVSGFGEDGPLGGLPGYDAAIQAMSGLMSINGTPDQEPLKVAVPIIDMVTGLNAVAGILMAVYERGRSGLGQFVDATLFDCALSVLHPHMVNFLYSGTPPKRTGNAHPNITPYAVFETRTAPIMLAVGNDGQFRKFCDYINRPDLPGDPRFTTNAQRTANRAALEAEICPILKTHDGPVLADALIRAGVPCGPVLSLGEVAAHPHTAHREMVIDAGGYRGVASPIKLSRTAARYRRLPPAFGEHTEAILAEIDTAAENGAGEGER